MSQLIIKCKKNNENAKIPTKSNTTDAGWDLYSCENTSIPPGEYRMVDTGISCAIPPGYCGIIFDRSGMGSKGIHRFCGIVDSDYRGTIRCVLYNANKEPSPYAVRDMSGNIQYISDISTRPSNDYSINTGDRIAQMLILPIPKVEMIESKELDDTERGQGGFGSTGK